MRRALKYGVLAAGMMARLGYGQSLADQTSFRSMSVGGIRLYGVSVFSGYSTSAYPGSFGQLQPGAGLLEASVSYGASASVGWQRHRDRSSFSMLYSGTYAGMTRYSEANAYSQRISLSHDSDAESEMVGVLFRDGVGHHHGPIYFPAFDPGSDFTGARQL